MSYFWPFTWCKFLYSLATAGLAHEKKKKKKITPFISGRRPCPLSVGNAGPAGTSSAFCSEHRHSLVREYCVDLFFFFFLNFSFRFHAYLFYTPSRPAFILTALDTVGSCTTIITPWAHCTIVQRNHSYMCGFAGSNTSS